jgi:hypothetical protein
VAEVLTGDTAEVLVQTMQDLVARVANLEYMLPGNVANIADIPYIMSKLNEFDYKLNNRTVYEFDITTDTLEYYIPADITPTSEVYLDGLLLNYGEDYTITTGKMIFSIPLIDGLTVTIKY